jgi:hypothetical protein
LTLNAPLRLHPAQVRAGVVERLDHRLEVAVGAVQDRAGREHPRADHPAGLHQLGLREHELGAGRRVVQGGDAEREVGVVGPVLLRDHALAEMRGMRVRVDDARDDGLAARRRCFAPAGTCTCAGADRDDLSPRTTSVPSSITSSRSRHRAW